MDAPWSTASAAWKLMVASIEEPDPIAWLRAVTQAYLEFASCATRTGSMRLLLDPSRARAQNLERISRPAARPRCRWWGRRIEQEGTDGRIGGGADRPGVAISRYFRARPGLWCRCNARASSSLDEAALPRAKPTRWRRTRSFAGPHAARGQGDGGRHESGSCGALASAVMVLSGAGSERRLVPDLGSRPRRHGVALVFVKGRAGGGRGGELHRLRRAVRPLRCSSAMARPSGLLLLTTVFGLRAIRWPMVVVFAVVVHWRAGAVPALLAFAWRR